MTAARPHATACRVAIVAATAPDAPAVAALHSEVFAEAWDEVAVARLIEAPGAIALMAVDADARSPCGFLIAQTAAGEAEILSIGVKPGVQKRGIAGALVVSFLTAAGGVGTSKVFLEVAEDNLAARALYARHGFEAVGRRRGYYLRGATKIDALLLRATLLSTA